MFIYLCIYLVLMTIGYICLSPPNENFKWMFIVGFGLLLFIVLGFRSETVGSDTLTYKAIFKLAPAFKTDLSLFFDSRFEIGFLRFNQFIYHQFHQNFTALLVAYAAISLSFYFVGIIKESQNIFLSLNLFLSFRIYFMMFSNIRQPVAMGLVFLSYSLLKKDKKIASLALIVLASSFHLSALMFIPIIFIKDIKFRGIKLAIPLVATVAVYYSFSGLLVRFFDTFDKYASYQNSSLFSNGNGNLAIILQFLLILASFLLGELLTRRAHFSSADNVLRNIMIVSVALSFINIQAPALTRGALYYTQFLILYLPMVLSKMKSRRIAQQYTWVIVIIFFIYNIGLMILRPEFNIIVPYTNVLF